MPKDEIEYLLQPRTRRCCEQFARCPDCRRLYWPGAHAQRLGAIAAEATRRKRPDGT